ncbi:A/G-specific adenine glycosylase [uncultured Flavobacterium sp.]|uniref:A/G-specific adenine glycosylase n=1 Tax=uncultured Flavobacterium sp. TaxID=165435 RepID=UPI0030EF1168|tara:strand:+ start:2231 stop:3262 length:1032 start_codon:yes stop_codon:yes gene_type:complete
MSFSNSLIHWYLQNKRDLPWRNTTDSYTIWLSEIILQQTRVAQGTPYFEAFISTFPTVFDLAKANEEQVLKLWQGLGYYSRARNLHATAKYVVDELNGVFPTSYNELIKLKGIGEYTAAAIASFSVNENVAVLDGNVYRVLARYFNVHNDISVSSTKKVFQELAKEVLPKKNAHIYNQAIMEFGALQCVPKSPNCSECTFSDSCAALQNKTVAILPIKSKKTKVTSRYFNYIVFEDLNGNTTINQRLGKGIWQNLYEFPVIEIDSIINEDEIINLISKEYSNITNIIFLPTYDVVHKLSHQTLYIQFIKVQISTELKDFISTHDLKKLPFPIVIHNFIERYFS